MHGRATCEIEAAELEGPAVRVPGPVGDRVVDYGRPDEDEDYAGQDARPIDGCADGEGWSVETGKHECQLCITPRLVTWGRTERGREGERTHVMAANMPWKRQNSRSGTLVLPTDGWARVFMRPKLDRSPIYALPVCEKARL